MELPDYILYLWPIVFVISLIAALWMTMFTDVDGEGIGVALGVTALAPITLPLILFIMVVMVVVWTLEFTFTQLRKLGKWIRSNK